MWLFGQKPEPRRLFAQYKIFPGIQDPSLVNGERPTVLKA